MRYLSINGWLLLHFVAQLNAHDTLLLTQIDSTFSLYSTVPVGQFSCCLYRLLDKEKSELSKCKPLLCTAVKSFGG